MKVKGLAVGVGVARVVQFTRFEELCKVRAKFGVSSMTSVTVPLAARATEAKIGGAGTRVGTVMVVDSNVTAVSDNARPFSVAPVENVISSGAGLNRYLFDFPLTFCLNMSSD
jgi:hypothetical protein